MRSEALPAGWRARHLCRVGLAALAVLALGAVGAVADSGADDHLGDLSLEQLRRIRIVTPSRVPESLAKTAATVSVITAPEIATGARTLADALALVPGIGVETSGFGDVALAVRGIRTTYSEQVLVMVDGHVLNDVRSGSATYQFLDRLAVDNIERIEVVRGPGSALYGANAMLAVVHVLTRDAAAAAGVHASVGTEWDRENNVANRYDLLLGREAGDWKAVANVQLVNGPGAWLPVTADALGRAGEADARERYVDVQSAVEHGPLRLSGRYLGREAGDGFGAYKVLNGRSNQEVRAGYLDARLRTALGPATDLTLHAYGDHQDTDNYYVILPAGSIPPGHPLEAWNGTGYIADLLAQELVGGAELQFDRRVEGGHLVSAGAAYRHEELDDPRLLANFDPYPLPVVTDVSDHFNWIRAGERHIASAFAQDLWDVSPAVRLTLGARYDHFSDFGSTFNPRGGLTVQLGPRAEARLTYASAFRAPDFTSLYLTDNLASAGNPALSPEKARTAEAGITVRPVERLQVSATLYHTELRELIDVSPASAQYENLGSATTQGLELEGRWQLGGRVIAGARYAYADPEFSGTSPFAIEPRHAGGASVSGPLFARVHGHLEVRAQSETRRSAADTRGPMAGYGVVNGALTAPLGSLAELQVAVRNALDHDVRHPAPPGTYPGDLPGAGRSVVVTLRAWR